MWKSHETHESSRRPGLLLFCGRMNRVQTVTSEGGEFRFTPKTIHQIPFPESVKVFERLGGSWVFNDFGLAPPYQPPAQHTNRFPCVWRMFYSVENFLCIIKKMRNLFPQNVIPISILFLFFPILKRRPAFGITGDE